MAVTVKIIGAVLVTLLLLLAAGIAVPFLLDWSCLTGRAASLASGLLERPTSIGHLDVEPGWTSRVRLQDLRVANPDWAESAALLEISEVDLAVELWPLLGGRLVLPNVEVLEPRLALERTADGEDEIEVKFEGPSLAEVFPILAVPLPDTPPYSLTGALERKGALWSLADFHGVVGDSDLSGSLTLDRGGDKPFLRADMVSPKLDFDDLAGLIGAEPDPQKAVNAKQQGEAREDRADDEVLPDTPVLKDRLYAMNMDVTFEGTEIVAEDLPIDKLSARPQLTDGRVLVRPLRFLVAGGQVAGEMALNARRKVPSADADLTFDDLDLEPFFEDTELLREMGGRFSGRIYVLGVGNSLADMLAVARGGGWIGMRDGSISALLVEAICLDVVEALALVIEDDARVRIRCGRMDFDAESGVVKAKRAIVDTTDSILLARGQADLSVETLDFEVEARAKNFSLIDATAPVSLSGTFDEPDIANGGLDPLPFLEMGDAEDVDCARLLSGRADQLGPDGTPADD